MLKIDCKTSYYQFDDWGMCIVPTDSLSHRDSLGRTVLCWIAYGRPEELYNSIMNCLELDRDNTEFILYRHPKHREKSSRDHWSYVIIMKKLKDDGWFNQFMSFIPKMRGMNLWMKSLTGDSKAEFWYYVWNIPGARLGNWWLRTLRYLMNCGNRMDEATNEWWLMPYIYDIPIDWNKNFGKYLIQKRTTWQKLWAWIIFQTIPAYSLHVKAWQIYVLPESKKKSFLKRILLKRVGKSNLMLWLLLGDTTVTQEEVDAYPHMTGYRPGVYLDETCRRDIREMTPEEAEANTYEVDLIKYLWKCGNTL